MENAKIQINREDALRLVSSIILDPDKFCKIFVDSEGVSKEYSYSDETIDRMANVSTITVIKSDATAKIIALKALELNREAFVDWLISGAFTLRLRIEGNETIGYRVDHISKDRSPLNNASVVFRKSVNHAAEYGFYVSGVYPVD